MLSVAGQENGKKWGDSGGLEDDTYMGKSDFSESSVVILYLHFLHERTNN